MISAFVLCQLFSWRSPPTQPPTPPPAYPPNTPWGTPWDNPIDSSGENPQCTPRDAHPDYAGGYPGRWVVARGYPWGTWGGTPWVVPGRPPWVILGVPRGTLGAGGPQGVPERIPRGEPPVVPRGGTLQSALGDPQTAECIGCAISKTYPQANRTRLIPRQQVARFRSSASVYEPELPKLLPSPPHRNA